MNGNVLNEIICLFIIVVVFIGLIGGYFQLRLMEYIKHKNAVNIFFGWWVFDPSGLESEGKYYRKKILICACLAGLLMAVILSLQRVD